MENSQLKKALEENQVLKRDKAAVTGYDPKTRQATLSFASDTPYTRWGETEILCCTEKAMNISRFKDDVMVALFNHDRDAVIGKPVKMWCENNKAYAVLQFADTDRAKEVEKLVADGTLKGVSVGYVVHKYEYLDEKSTSEDGYKGPAYVARDWEVLEFSLVSVPADPTVGIGRNHNGDDDKTKEVTPPPAGATPVKAEPNTATAVISENKGETTMEGKTPDMLVKEAQAKENARCRDLDALATKYNIDNETRSKWLQDPEMTAEKAQGVVLEKLAADNAALKNANAQNTKVTADETDKIRAAYADAIIIRSGATIEKPAEGAMGLVGMNFKKMAADLLLREGEKNVLRMTDGELFERAMTTGTFANILDLTARISAAKAYQEQVTTFQEWVNYGTLNDFKTAYRYRIGDAEEPELIPENGEFKYAENSGTTVGVKLDTEGIAWAFTRQAFINDDLSILTKLPRKYAMAFKRKINRLCYVALAGMNYTGAKSHGTAGAVSTTTVAEARALLRKAKVDKAYLNIPLAFLLVPTKEEQAALELLDSTANPSGANSGVTNTFRNKFKVICDANLDDIDEKAWYAMGDRNMIDGVEVNYLNGRRDPILEAKDDWNKLGRSYRMYLDFGITAISNVGIIKNAGVE